MNVKILFVFGTRPEAIKMCPLILEARKRCAIETVVCLTGQHKEMLHQVMAVFDIKADYNLEIMRSGQDLFSITQDSLSGLKKIYEIEKPNMVIVHGDTTTAFAGALAAFYEKIPIGHVEAGLRTGDIYSPYPEEFNRQAIDIMADLYFAPTGHAGDNLIKEGKNKKKIIVTGNTVIDALKMTVKHDYDDRTLEWASDSKMILLTMHRRENIGKPMAEVFKACKRLLDTFSDVKFIYPVHKNPEIRRIVENEFGDNKRIAVIEPLDVLQFHNYMNKSFFIMTDSGGIQEEAPTLGKPVLVLRKVTERPEGLESGNLKLVGTNENDVYNAAAILLNNQFEYEKMSKANTPYGDGTASEYIVDAIISWLGKGKNEYKCKICPR